jgi:prepilin-type N-terminal cleavage/methylation domain-containing protein
MQRRANEVAPDLRVRRAPAGTIERGRRRWPFGRRSFTLVELLVALTIGSLLVVSVVSATRALSGTRQSAERRMARSSAARRAMETIVAALRNVRRDPIRDQPVIVGHPGGADGDRIDLQVISDHRVRPDGAESDQYEMSFFLAKPAGQPWPVLMCRKDHGLDEHPADGGIVTVVTEGIIALSFQYYVDNQWSDQWSSVEPRAPDAVRVTVVAVGSEAGDARVRPTPLSLSTVVPIRVNPPTEAQAPERPTGPAPGRSGSPPSERPAGPSSGGPQR